MSWTWQANRGSNNNKAAGTTLEVTLTGTVAAGRVLIVSFVSDNQGTTQGDTTSVTCTDDQGNTYTRLFEYTKTAGSAADGVTLAAFYSVITTQLTTSDTVNLSFNNVIAKSASLEEWSIAGTLTVKGSNTSGGTGTSPTVTLGSLASAEYLWIGAVGIEGPNGDTYTQDSDYSSSTTNHGTTGGGDASNVACRLGDRIYTGSSDTFNPTLGTARDYATGLTALEDTGAAAAPLPEIMYQYRHRRTS